MVENKSINGLGIERVFSSNPLKINTGNLAIFINVIHGVLRVANFLSFFSLFWEVRSPVFYETSFGFPYLQIRDLLIFYFHLIQHSTRC